MLFEADIVHNELAAMLDDDDDDTPWVSCHAFLLLSAIFFSL